MYTHPLTSDTLCSFESLLPFRLIPSSCLKGKRESCLTISVSKCGSAVPLVGTECVLRKCLCTQEVIRCMDTLTYGSSSGHSKWWRDLLGRDRGEISCIQNSQSFPQETLPDIIACGGNDALVQYPRPQLSYWVSTVCTAHTSDRKH